MRPRRRSSAFAWTAGALLLSLLAAGSGISPEPAWSRAPGRVAVWPSPANGGRDALLFIPSALDPTRPVRLFIYFHGHGGDVGEHLLRNGVIERVGDACRRDPQSLFLFPRAAAPPFTYWMRPPESLHVLTQEALERSEGLLGRRPAVAERVVDAHSGGGLALKNAAQAGELVADQVNLLDAAYGDWGQEITCWALAEARAGRHARVRSWWTPHSSLPRNNAQMLSWAPRLVRAFETDAGHGDVPARFAFTWNDDAP